MKKVLHGHLLGVMRDVCVHEAKTKNQFNDFETEMHDLKKWLDDIKIKQVLNGIMYKNFRDINQSRKLEGVLCLPFYQSFVLQEKPLKYLLLGEIPCYKLEFNSDSPHIDLVIKLLTQPTINTHLIPLNIISALETEGVTTLVIESIPTLSFAETSELIPLISSEHKKDMLLVVIGQDYSRGLLLEHASL